MISYRKQLAKIGWPAGTPVSYRSFFLASDSLRETMRSMDFPGSIVESIPGKEQDLDWTDEIQGCAFAHNRWFFVSNRDGAKHLFVFDGPTGKKIKTWNLAQVPPPDPPLPKFSFFHFGAIIIDGNSIFIDHWSDAGGQVMEFEGDGASLTFVRWINLTGVGERVGMIGIHFGKRRIITAGGNLNVDRLFLHSLDDGAFLNKTLFLQPPITDNCYAQGGFWSPNNHIYVSSGQGGLTDTAKGHQFIYSYSPISGQLLNKIAVTTAAGRQELEGCCFANVIRNGKQVFIHAVLLENEVAKDDIFLKSFSADQPELI